MKDNNKTLDEIYSQITPNKTEWMLAKSKHSGVYQRLKFKTGGIRGKLSEGYNGINEVTCNLLATSLCKHFNSIVIGFDHRFYSSKFAYIFYKIFSLKNKKIAIFKECITPYLAYESENYDVGVMITASHNPKEYNGFKVYVKGSQISDPLDREIESDMESCHFTDILEHLLGDWEDELLFNQIDYEKYFKTFNLNKFTGIHKVEPLFSGLYGVSTPFIKEACKFFNIKINTFSITNIPDPNFPGIKYPNPEVAENHIHIFGTNDSVVFMCDPDGDRFGMSVVQSNIRTVFNGDEIMEIFLYWFLKNYENISLVNTNLCSSLFKSVSDKLGIEYIQTDTGFKYVSRAVKLLMEKRTNFKNLDSIVNTDKNEVNSGKDEINSGKDEISSGNAEINAGKDKTPVILAYEDSLGFLLGSGKEKDGIKAAVLMYMILQENEISEIFKEMSKFGIHNTYNLQIRVKNTELSMSRILKDLDYKKIGDRIVVEFDDMKITLRISGTESVIKVYSMTEILVKQELKDKVNQWIKENIECKIDKS